jgi:hypothetical protein
MVTAVVTNEARRLAPGRASSDRAAAAAPVTTPAERPESARARKSSATPLATMKTTLRSTPNAMAPAMIGRRPAWSEAPPKNNSVASRATAYTANTTVSVDAEKAHWCW